MSTYIQWSLYGKDTAGKPLPESDADKLRDALDEEVTEWHGENPGGELIGQFLSTYNNGYSSITEIVGNFARTMPGYLFQLACHNEDEDWYQQIHFHGDDREDLDGHVVYDMPQRIFYHAPDTPKEE